MTLPKITYVFLRSPLQPGAIQQEKIRDIHMGEAYYSNFVQPHERRLRDILQRAKIPLGPGNFSDLRRYRG